MLHRVLTSELTLQQLQEYHAATYLEVSHFVLTSLEIHNPYTAEHCRDVGRLASLLVASGSTGVEDGFTSTVSGALNHDAGKLFIPNSILDKEGALTEEDWVYIRRHPADSFRLIVECTDDVYTAYVALMHHLFQDKPYPNDEVMDELVKRIFGPKGAYILEDPNVVKAGFTTSFADVIDAIGSRPYNRNAGKIAMHEIIDIAVKGLSSAKTIKKFKQYGIEEQLHDMRDVLKSQFVDD